MEPNDTTPADHGNLEQRLGHVFRQPERLAAALTHGSHAAEQPEPGPVAKAAGSSVKAVAA